ncbi:hypothetical protein WG66_009764 [Moniliophthora roreri]|nr:hypothetical protein WG66_005084 [Moniliophthora roreri]KAI3614523.1 hypothetical protein WG66_009764 [Moniliophthora roreri]
MHSKKGTGLAVHRRQDLNELRIVILHPLSILVRSLDKEYSTDQRRNSSAGVYSYSKLNG